MADKLSITEPFLPQNIPLIREIESLEQMRLRALERLYFEKEREESAPISARYDTMIERLDRGIDEMILALASRRALNLEDAFDKFAGYTTLERDASFFELREESWFARNIIEAPFKALLSLRNWQGPVDGKGFRQTLRFNDVDVDGLIVYSKIENADERNRWLLSYVKGLRDHFGSLRGFPAFTIEKNLERLAYSRDTKTAREAEEMLSSVKGEGAFTGMGDAEFAALMRFCSEGVVPLAASVLISLPLAAYVEETVAGLAIERSGRLIWSGANAAAKAGTVAKASGLAALGASVWAWHDHIHSLTVGGGDYYTLEGLARTYAAIIAIGSAMGLWRATLGARLSSVPAASSMKLPAEIANFSGRTLLEWEAFFGAGYLEKAAGLKDGEEWNSMKELVKAGALLLQIKAALAAGSSLTAHTAEAAALRVRLEHLKQRIQSAQSRGLLSYEAYIRRLSEVVWMEGTLAGLGGYELSYAGAGFSVRPEHLTCMSSTKGNGGSRLPSVKDMVLGKLLGRAKQHETVGAKEPTPTEPPKPPTVIDLPGSRLVVFLNLIVRSRHSNGAAVADTMIFDLSGGRQAELQVAYDRGNLYIRRKNYIPVSVVSKKGGTQEVGGEGEEGNGPWTLIQRGDQIVIDGVAYRLNLPSIDQMPQEVRAAVNSISAISEAREVRTSDSVTWLGITVRFVNTGSELQMCLISSGGKVGVYRTSGEFRQLLRQGDFLQIENGDVIRFGEGHSFVFDLPPPLKIAELSFADQRKILDMEVGRLEGTGLTTSLKIELGEESVWLERTAGGGYEMTTLFDEAMFVIRAGTREKINFSGDKKVPIRFGDYFGVGNTAVRFILPRLVSMPEPIVSKIAEAYASDAKGSFAFRLPPSNVRLEMLVDPSSNRFRLRGESGRVMSSDRYYRLEEHKETGAPLKEGDVVQVGDVGFAFRLPPEAKTRRMCIPEDGIDEITLVEIVEESPAEDPPPMTETIVLGPEDLIPLEEPTSRKSATPPKEFDFGEDAK